VPEIFSMTAREQMMDRVRRALGRTGTQAAAPTLPDFDLRGVMPPITSDDLLATFEAEWEKVAGVSYRVASRAELDSVFEVILVLAETHAITLSGNPLLAELGIAEQLSKLNKFVTVWDGGTGITGKDSLSDFTRASFAAGAGITGVDYVLAESGTLVLSSATEGVQVASLAPPIHIAIYRRSQLVASLDEVLAKLQLTSGSKRTALGRSVVFITGTSRTADIEQILIRGVHGPREVHAVLVEDSV
jgi:L-lactate dehydrogenase complex protein LldG